MRTRGAWVALALGVLLGACEKHEFEPPDRERQVGQADSLFTPALFDSIAWPSDSARAFEGNNVFAAHCRKCHGPTGQGDTEYTRQRELVVPSLVRADWEHGTDVESVRHRVFTGHPAGMPTFGVAGISLREIDAVSYYIIAELRPEMTR